MAMMTSLIDKGARMSTLPEGDFFTVSEVADHLKVATATVRNMIRDKQLPALRVRNVWRIKREDLEAFVAQEGTASPPDEGSVYG